MSSRPVSPVTHSFAQRAAINCKSVVLLTRTCKNAWLATRSETRPSLPDTRSQLALQGGFASEFNCNRYPRATSGECRQTPEVRGRRPSAARSARSFDLIPRREDCYFLYQKRELPAEIRSVPGHRVGPSFPKSKPGVSLVPGASGGGKHKCADGRDLSHECTGLAKEHEGNQASPHTRGNALASCPDAGLLSGSRTSR